MNRFFIIEENGSLKNQLTRTLFQRGEMVFYFQFDSFSADEIILKRPDMVILGMVASPHFGNNLCRVIKSEHDNLPVIALIEKKHLSKLDYTTGIDDFILSESSEAELESRIAILLWKYNKIESNSTLKIEGLKINLANYNVTIDNLPVELTFKEFELLKFLATHQGRAYTREMLLNQVWDVEYYGGARTVDVHIRRLRFKLGRYEDLIQTIRNVGYKFGK